MAFSNTFDKSKQPYIIGSKDQVENVYINSYIFFQFTSWNKSKSCNKENSLIFSRSNKV